MTKALADRLAEAFAELLHEQRPPRLGLRPRRASDERGDDRGEISRHPPGGRLSVVSRPHREGDAVDAADVEAAAGIRLTESYAMTPARVGERLVFRPSRRRRISPSIW